jgi:hypothetical protein
MITNWASGLRSQSFKVGDFKVSKVSKDRGTSIGSNFKGSGFQEGHGIEST